MQQYFELPSLDATIRKPIVDGVVQRVLNESGIDQASVIFEDEANDTAYQPGSTLGDEVPVDYASPERVYVEVEEERDEYARINRQVGMQAEPYFFENVDDQVRAWPVRTMYNMTITLRRHSASRDELLRWTNRLDSLIDMGRFSIMTEAEAFYYIPRPALHLINACYVAAETRVPKFDDFKAYLKAHFTPDVFVTGNVAGGQESLSVRYAPTRLETVYDVQVPAWDKDENRWEASFVIRFSYQRPEEIVVSYPYIINQTPLPEEYWPEIDPPWLSNEEDVQRHAQQRNLDSTWWINETRQLIRLPYLLSPTEQFHRTHSPLKSKLLHVFGTDVVFDADNMVNPHVVNVDDLPYVWNKDLLPYIEHCRAIDPTGQRGVFRTELFEEGQIIEPRFYHWENGTLSLRGRDVKVNKGYYLTESVIYDWRNFDLWPLQLYPKAAKVLIEWLFPNWDVPSWWWDLPKFPPSVDDDIKKLTPTPDKRILLTIFNTTIFTMRGTENAESVA
ncbi:hypothetical protein ASESINO_78 [Erwinia phage vB_EamM_Asesino]|uniref:Uncharacterized protein n=1 Tax=Erwinia phage vB_EamM_Asesino TaxID=1883370 RepID=A0A1B2IA17_9CAUD|nr:hypothetical protein ASESINO_78 [Erwinia phage vB_EamM_Asesino]ANZ48091.1 hypothetical protein ASESINO_78 [Erwinia phage vB_EamM_Asesino]